VNKSFFRTENLQLGYNISKNKNYILDNINLEASKNELVCLIGKNGSGKSTLLKSFAQIHDIYNGNIFIENHNIKNIGLKYKAKKISFVTTEIINVTNLKVKDLVMLGRFPHTNWIGKTEIKDKDEIYNSLEKVGMLAFANKFVNELSDGERQRVMIARSLAQDTDIILLDEPTAFLDLNNKYQLIKLLHNLAKEKNKLIIFSTHDLNIVLKLVDKVWLIIDNKIISGSPEDIVLNNYLVDIFKNSELKFDYAKMDFDFEFAKKYSIDLINKTDSEIHNNLTIKALERINFFVDKKNDSKIIILNQNNIYKWILKKQSSEIEFDNIYKLIQHLSLILNH